MELLRPFTRHSHHSETTMALLRTERLELVPLAKAHAPLLLDLFNDPDFLRFVGDKGLRTVAQCEDYIASTAIPAQVQGITNYAVRLRDSDQWLGTCGLLQRPYFDAPDLGYGFLPAGRGLGLAREAARAILSQANIQHWPHLWAMVNLKNLRSRQLLLDLQFKAIAAEAHACPLPNTLVMARSLADQLGQSPV